MGQRMHLGKLADGDVGIELRGSGIGMAEQSLDEAQLGAVLQHVRGTGVAEQMARTRCIDAGVFQVPLHPVAEFVITERLTVIAQEQRLLADVGEKLGPHRVEVTREPRSVRKSGCCINRSTSSTLNTTGRVARFWMMMSRWPGCRADGSHASAI